MRFEWKYDWEYKKSALLIGEVIGHLEQYVGDEFIQYRLLHLIKRVLLKMKELTTEWGIIV